jgi:hypothetical protein
VGVEFAVAVKERELNGLKNRAGSTTKNKTGGKQSNYRWNVILELETLSTLA